MNRTSELKQIGDEGKFLFTYIFQLINEQAMIEMKISVLWPEFCLPPNSHVGALSPRVEIGPQGRSLRLDEGIKGRPSSNKERKRHQISLSLCKHRGKTM